jgi:hypothetical protein
MQSLQELMRLQFRSLELSEAGTPLHSVLLAAVAEREL